MIFVESIANNFHGLTNGYSNTLVRDTGLNNRLCNLKSRFKSITRQHYCFKSTTLWSVSLQIIY